MPISADPPKRQRRDPVATRNAILEAAERLLIAHGVADTPTSRIAREAGVTKSLIHHHFGSKEALWNAVKVRRFEAYYTVQKELLVGSSGSADLLRQSIISFFRFLQADPQAVRFMSWRLFDGDDPSLEQEEELFALGIQRIEEGQAAGELRADLEPIAILKAFIGLAHHWFQSKHLTCQCLPAGTDMSGLDEAYLDTVLKIFFEGASPQG